MIRNKIPILLIFIVLLLIGALPAWHIFIKQLPFFNTITLLDRETIYQYESTPLENIPFEPHINPRYTHWPFCKSLDDTSVVDRSFFCICQRGYSYLNTPGYVGCIPTACVYSSLGVPLSEDFFVTSVELCGRQVEKKDWGGCNLIPKENARSRDICYFGVFSVTQNRSICNGLTSTFLRNKCILEEEK